MIFDALAAIILKVRDFLVRGITRLLEAPILVVVYCIWIIDVQVAGNKALSRVHPVNIVKPIALCPRLKAFLIVLIGVKTRLFMPIIQRD